MIDAREPRKNIVDAGVEGGTNQDSYGNHVEPDQKCDGGGQRAVDRRAPDRFAQNEAQEQLPPTHIATVMAAPGRSALQRVRAGTDR